MKLGPYWLAEQKKRQQKAAVRWVAKVALLSLTFFIVGIVTTNWTALTSNLPTYYPSCSWARSAGKAPIIRGEAGYRSALDADRDGVACEPYSKN